MAVDPWRRRLTTSTSNSSCRNMAAPIRRICWGRAKNTSRRRRHVVFHPSQRRSVPLGRHHRPQHVDLHLQLGLLCRSVVALERQARQRHGRSAAATSASAFRATRLTITRAAGFTSDFCVSRHRVRRPGDRHRQLPRLRAIERRDAGGVHRRLAGQYDDSGRRGGCSDRIVGRICR